MRDNPLTDRIAARLALAGVKRRKAAGAANMSYSAINRKLRGELPLSPGDTRRLNELAVKARAQAGEGDS